MAGRPRRRARRNAVGELQQSLGLTKAKKQNLARLYVRASALAGGPLDREVFQKTAVKPTVSRRVPLALSVGDQFARTDIEDILVRAAYSLAFGVTRESWVGGREYVGGAGLGPESWEQVDRLRLVLDAEGYPVWREPVYVIEFAPIRAFRTEYGPAEDVEGLWVHVFNRAAPQTATEWTQFLSLPGEISVSLWDPEKPGGYFAPRKGTLAVLFAGTVSLWWPGDIYSVQATGGWRYPTRPPEAAHGLHDEGFLTPARAKPIAILVSPHAPKRLRDRFVQSAQAAAEIPVLGLTLSRYFKPDHSRDWASDRGHAEQRRQETAFDWEEEDIGQRWKRR